MFSNIKTLTDDVLINEILPKLPLTDLIKLCQSDKQFETLCQSNQLWQNRSRLSINPNMLNQLLNGYQQDPFSWKNFYLYTMSSFTVPIYIYGDIVNTQPIYYNNLELTIDDLITSLEKPFDIYSIIFLDELSRPISTYSYPSNESNYFSDELKSIKKIVIVPEVIKSIRERESSRGRKPNSTYLEKQKKHLIQNINNIIFTYLTSRANNLPLYAIVENDQLKFIIHQPTPSALVDNRVRNKGKLCQLFSGNELVLMIDLLEIDTPVNRSHEDLCQIIADELQKRGHFHKF